MPRSPKTFRVSLWLILALAMCLTASACNTMKGFGQDLSNLGDSITGKAEKHTDR
jgi:predicted small secreted protein